MIHGRAAFIPAREFTAQPGVSDAKFVTNNVHTPSLDCSALLRGHAAEVAHFDELRERLALARERFQHQIQFQEADLRFARFELQGESIIQRNGLVPMGAREGGARPGMVHQNTAHRLRDYGKEMRAIGKLQFAMAKKLQIGFVNQRGGLQGMAGPFVAETPLGEAAQRWINHGQQLVAGGCVSATKLLQQRGNVLPRSDDGG